MHFPLIFTGYITLTLHLQYTRLRLKNMLNIQLLHGCLIWNAQHVSLYCRTICGFRRVKESLEGYCNLPLYILRLSWNINHVNVNATNENIHKGHNISRHPKSLLIDNRHTKCWYKVPNHHSTGSRWVSSCKDKREMTSFCFIVCIHSNFQWRRRLWKRWFMGVDGLGVYEYDDSVELLIYILLLIYCFICC